jgi:hypothetical protein
VCEVAATDSGAAIEATAKAAATTAVLVEIRFPAMLVIAVLLRCWLTDRVGG